MTPPHGTRIHLPPPLPESSKKEKAIPPSVAADEVSSPFSCDACRTACLMCLGMDKRRGEIALEAR
jgi:hypothetical protein